MQRNEKGEPIFDKPYKLDLTDGDGVILQTWDCTSELDVPCAEDVMEEINYVEGPLPPRSNEEVEFLEDEKLEPTGLTFAQYKERKSQ